MRRMLAAAPIVAVALVAALSPPSGADDAVATKGAQETGSLLGPARVARSATFTLSGAFPTRPRDTVLLQRRTSDGDWVQVKKGATQQKGHFTFDVRASSHAGFVVYRSLVPRSSKSALKTETWRVEVARPGRWAQLSQGGSTTCGIKKDDTGWCWGRGDFGQLGIGSRGDTVEPHRLPGRWRSVTRSGIRTTCGIRLDRSGWCWGGNPGNGQDSSDVPVRLEGEWRTLTPTSYAEFGGDAVNYTCGIQTDDSAWCWGDNAYGNLGIGDTGTPVLTPRRLTGAWRTIVPGAASPCGIQTDGTGWCWGRTPWTGGDGTLTNRSAHPLGRWWESISRAPTDRRAGSNLTRLPGAGVPTPSARSVTERPPSQGPLRSSFPVRGARSTTRLPRFAASVPTTAGGAGAGTRRVR